MASSCPICTHPSRALIDEAMAVDPLTAKGVAGAIGGKFSPSVLRTHRDKHLSAQLVADAKAIREIDADVLLGGLIAAMQQVRTLTHTFTDPADKIRAFREFRSYLELLAKISGEYVEKLALVGQRGPINEHPDWAPIQDAIAAALWPYPEARQAVADALGRVTEPERLRPAAAGGTSSDIRGGVTIPGDLLSGGGGG